LNSKTFFSKLGKRGANYGCGKPVHNNITVLSTTNSEIKENVSPSQPAILCDFVAREKSNLAYDSFSGKAFTK
jgi:hypothetical protein